MGSSLFKIKDDYNTYRGDDQELTSPRLFRAGEEVIGVKYEGPDASQYPDELFIIDNGYIMAGSNLQLKYNVDDEGKEIVQTPLTKEAEKLIKELDEISSKQTVKSIITKSRQSVNGMLTGGAIGAITALAFKKSVFWGVLIGATLGGLIGSKMKMPESIKNYK